MAGAAATASLVAAAAAALLFLSCSPAHGLESLHLQGPSAASAQADPDLRGPAAAHSFDGSWDGLKWDQQRSEPSTSDVVVHLFEWSWDDVAKECESFLGPAGYKAVQVSPAQEDIQGNHWWTRYQPVSYKLDSRSGSRQQFADMMRRCEAAGVDIIADVVLNHMAATGAGSGRGRAGTHYGPGCRRFPEMYSCNDFHHYTGDCCNNCQMWNDADLFNLQYCDIGLPDLDTASDWVQQKQAEYLRDLADLGVKGIRVDAAKHIPAADLRAIIGRAGRQLYANLEIIVPPWVPCAVDVQDYYDLGRVWEFKYPRLISDAFKQRRLDLLSQMGSYSWAQWASPERAMSFVVNHDRLAHGRDRLNTVTPLDPGLYPLALAFLLAHPYGQPNLLSSVNISPGDLDQQGDYGGAPVDPSGRLVPVHGGATSAGASSGSASAGAGSVANSSSADTAGGASSGGGASSRSSGDIAEREGEQLNCGLGRTYLCEHRWRQVAAMVRWRAVVGPAGASSDISLWQVLNNNAALALARGPSSGPSSRGFLLINAAYLPGTEVRQRVRTGLPPGLYCNVLEQEGAGCRSPVAVAADGTADLHVPPLSAVALHINATASSS